MAKDNDLSISTGILYRCTSRHFDKLLSDLDIGYAQLIFLTHIYENEGLTMNALAQKGSYDKGTVTKSLQKLEASGYIEIRGSESDRRQKAITTTAKCREIIHELFAEKQNWWNAVTADLSAEERDLLQSALNRMSAKAQELEGGASDSQVKLYGMEKLSMTDYPGRIACTLYTAGCNMRCPSCCRRDLVFLKETDRLAEEEEVFAYLEKRRGLLDGVCISGGEALMQSGIIDLLRRIKKLGYAVKLNTNGTYPEQLKEVIGQGLVDYVALDLKGPLSSAEKVTGLTDFDPQAVLSSIDLLKEDSVDYEFTTTVVKELHRAEDIRKIAELIKGAKRYVLETYKGGENVIREGLHPVSAETMKEYAEAAAPWVQEVLIRE